MEEKNPYDYSDVELIKGALANDRHYQEMLYRKYADAMYTIACNYSNSEEEAADILQEGFIKVFKYLKQQDANRSLGGWIKKIIINTALEHYRKNKRKEEIIADYANEYPPIEFEVEQSSSRDLIKYVNSLPEKAKIVLQLYILDGYPHQEIADLLGISVGTSKSQLNRAKFLLREMIGGKNV